jgi:hypothetical protein
MGLDPLPHQGFHFVSITVPSKEWAIGAVLALIAENRSFHLEPYPDDRWCFTVSTEHEAALLKVAT